MKSKNKHIKAVSVINVFIIVHDFSGARTYVDELSSYFVEKKNIEVYQIYLNSKNYKEFTIQKLNKVNIINIPNPINNIKNNDLKYYKSAALLIYQNFNSLKNVVLHINMADQYYFAEEIKKLFNIPVIFTLHYLEDFYSYLDHTDRYNLELNFKNTFFLEKILKLSDHIICVTEFAQRSISKIYNIETNRSSVIYNSTALQPKQQDNKTIKNNKLKFGFSVADQLLLYAGKLKSRKGLDNLIKAFLLIKDKHPNTKLIIAGSGDYGNYMPLAQECIGKILFTGNLKRDTLLDFYQFSDVGISPSNYEQCSYSVIEMMLFKLPLIISNVPGLNELITHKKTGLICKVKENETNPLSLEVDINDLALQIEYMLQNKSESHKMAEAAYNSIFENFSFHEMGNKTLDIYYNHLTLK